MVADFNRNYNSILPINRLYEFIDDARSKDGLDGEFEIEYFFPNEKTKKINSYGTFTLNDPEEGSITVIEKGTTKKYTIIPDEGKLNFYKYDINENDQLCFLSVEKSRDLNRKYIGIVCNITLGLDHGVTISADYNGTDWTGYLGG